MNKKVIFATIALAAVLTACENNKKDTQGTTTPSVAATETAAPEATTAAEETQAPEATAETAENTDVVMPIKTLTSAEDALADGGYSVAFTADDLVEKDNGYELTVEVFEEERYEAEAIEKLEEGAEIQSNGEVIKVENVQKKENAIFINGGRDNGGLELWDDDGAYRTVLENEASVYTSVGKITMPLAEDTTFEDHADIENGPEGKVYEMKDLPKAIQDSTSEFNQLNTLITVRGEKIVQIIRNYMP